MPWTELCEDCSTVARLVRNDEWTGPPYCSTHWVSMVQLACGSDEDLEAFVRHVRSRRRTLRLLGRTVDRRCVFCGYDGTLLVDGPWCASCDDTLPQPILASARRGESQAL